MKTATKILSVRLIFQTESTKTATCQGILFFFSGESYQYIGMTWCIDVHINRLVYAY